MTQHQWLSVCLWALADPGADPYPSSAWAGLDMVELLRTPLPVTFRHWAAVSTEFTRNVTHLYPQYEARSLHASTLP